MSHYIWDPVQKLNTGIGWVCVDERNTMGELLYFKPGFDPSLQRTFHDKADYRLFLKQHKLKQLSGNAIPGGNPWKGLAESRTRGKKVFVST